MGFPTGRRAGLSTGVDVTADVTVVPANEASWEDLLAIFGRRGYAAYCQCQRPKMRSWAEWRELQVAAWGELNVGSRSIFADAGFQEVSHPTQRRVVMRIDFD